MNIIYNFVKKHKISKANFIFTTTIICLTIYFVIFSIYGKNGFRDLHRLQQQISEAKDRERILLVKRKAKEDRVQKMKPESLDLDLLDEQVRENLGFVNDKEIMLYDKNNSNN